MAEEEMGTLDKLLGVVQNYKSGEQASSNTGGWIAGAVVLIIVLIGVAIFAYQQWQAGKERAKLLHEKAVQEEAAHQAVVDAALEDFGTVKSEALRRANAARTRVAILARRATELEKQRDEARANIDKITSWQYVDTVIL